ncbi:hypothetical protein FLX56_20095 [Synechococcus moorigangaii CMS01]|nr:hypothetical protein [Synechococcus moorigangaii CMS01]
MVGSSPISIALNFAQALVQGQFELARRLLAPTLQQQYSTSHLQRIFTEMLAYGDGPPTDVAVVATMTDWPEKQPADWGWVYVSIAGDGYGEAVTVIVGRDRLIRALEWGRP